MPGALYRIVILYDDLENLSEIVDELLVVREKIEGAFALGAVTGEHGFLRWVRKCVP